MICVHFCPEPNLNSRFTARDYRHDLLKQQVATLLVAHQECDVLGGESFGEQQPGCQRGFLNRSSFFILGEDSRDRQSDSHQCGGVFHQLKSGSPKSAWATDSTRPISSCTVTATVWANGRSLSVKV